MCNLYQNSSQKNMGTFIKDIYVPRSHDWEDPHELNCPRKAKAIEDEEDNITQIIAEESLYEENED